MSYKWFVFLFYILQIERSPVTLEFHLSEAEERELEQILETKENVDEIRKNYLASIEKTKKQLQHLRNQIALDTFDEQARRRFYEKEMRLAEQEANVNDDKILIAIARSSRVRDFELKKLESMVFDHIMSGKTFILKNPKTSSTSHQQNGSRKTSASEGQSRRCSTSTQNSSTKTIVLEEIH